MRRILRRKFRRLIRTIQPVVLGQTRIGFLLAAGLVGLWLAEKDAHATTQPQSSGSSENSYFKLEWDYDLAGGTGNFLFRIKDASANNPFTSFDINQLYFSTTGVDLSSIKGPGGTSCTIYKWQETGSDGRTIYHYPVAHAGIHIQADPADQRTFQFDLTFPTTGVRLQDSFMGLGSAVGYSPMTFLYPSPMNFVTIQSIPEPASIATLGLGAAAAAAGLRRKEEQGQA
jgi:hypothetical protein